METTRKEQFQNETTSSVVNTEYETDEHIITITENFDTSKPVDIQTGVPPLQQRTINTKYKTEKAAQISVVDKESDALKTEATSKQYDEQTSKIIDTESALNQQEQKERSKIGWLISALGAIIALSGIIKLLKYLKDRL